jgi:hypothetical protein
MAVLRRDRSVSAIFYARGEYRGREKLSEIEFLAVGNREYEMFFKYLTYDKSPNDIGHPRGFGRIVENGIAELRFDRTAAPIAVGAVVGLLIHAGSRRQRARLRMRVAQSSAGRRRPRIGGERARRA